MIGAIPVISQGAKHIHIQPQSRNHRHRRIGQPLGWGQRCCLTRPEGIGEVDGRDGIGAPEPFQIGTVIGTGLDIGTPETPEIIDVQFAPGRQEGGAFERQPIGRIHILFSQSAVPDPIAIGPKQPQGARPQQRQRNRARKVAPAAGAIRHVFRIEGAHLQAGIRFETGQITAISQLQPEQVAPFVRLALGWSPSRLARQGIGVSTAIDRPLQHELGFDK